MQTNKIKILNVGYPKTGNTWCGRTLSYALGAEFREYDHDGNLYRDTKVPEIIDKISGKKMQEKEVSNVEIVEKTHLLPYEWINYDKDHFVKMIYLSRDPRDVAISFFYYNYYLRPIEKNGEARIYSRWEKRKFLFTSVLDYSIHRVLWQSHTDACIEYEEHWDDAARTLRGALDKTQIVYSDERLAEAIEYFSWKNQAAGREPGETNNSSFLRSGKPEAWKNEYDYFDLLFFYVALLYARYKAVRRALLMREAFSRFNK